MSETVAYVRGSADTVLRALAHLPDEVLRGGEGRVILTDSAKVVLGKIREAFITKAAGGTDEAGDRWERLKPSTIAYSRTRRTRPERGNPSRPSQALSKKQAERWWTLYRQGLAMYGGDRGAAARRAWGILRREGASTLYDKYAGRPALILRDTDALLNSLSPDSGSPDQMVRVKGSTIEIGTKRPGAMAHHRGVPGRLPRRPLWPEPGRWPAKWWQEIAETVRRGVLDIVTTLIRSAR